MKKFAKMAVAAAIAGMAMIAQATIVIDDFSVDQGTDGLGDILLRDTTINGLGKYSSVNGATTSIIGGQRDLYVEKIGGGSGGIESIVESSMYKYSTPSGAAGTAFLKWDGMNEAVTGTVFNGSQATFLGTLSAGGLGGQNFKLGGNAFKIDVQEADIGFDFAMTVFSSGGRSTTLVLASVAHSGGLPDSSPIRFADFEGATDVGGSVLGSGAFRFTSAFGAADLTDVGALLAQVNFTGGIGTVDLSINEVITVPEPGSLALVGLAMLGLGAVRRRKAMAK